MSGSEPTTPIVTCYECGKEFLPHGNRLVKLPVSQSYKCPHCHAMNRVIWDVELERDFYRKRLGLTKDFVRLEHLTVEKQELKKRIDALETQAKILRKETEEVVSNFLIFVMKYGPLIDALEKEYKTLIKKPKDGYEE
jgi:DNA-directed RNA polymerase subunit RPC12/RpoP